MCAALSACVRECVCVRVCIHFEQPASHLLWKGNPFIKIFLLIWISFTWSSIRSLARDIDGNFLSVSLISSWIFFFKQPFETTTGILSTISWKFVVLCLRYNWLYSIVLTFQTALSTFILMAHLCIGLPFPNACCERHGYPVCLMWKENVFCFVKELSSIVVNTWTEVAELKKN